MFECEYCGNKFNKLYTLQRHQETAKYCLSLQNTDSRGYQCGYCGKKGTRKDNMAKHEKLCPQNPENVTDLTNLPKNELITKLVDILATMQRPTSHRKTVLDKLQPITENSIREHLKSLTLDFICEGAKGYADFAGNYPFKDKVLCTDRSRKKFRYKNEDGTISDDHRELVKCFFQTISERNAELVNQEYAVLHNKMQAIIADNNAEKVDISAILKKSINLQNILIKTQNAAKVGDDEFSREFLKHLSRKL